VPIPVQSDSRPHLAPPAALKGWKARSQPAAAGLAAADDAAITLSEHGKLWWDRAIVARLAAGSSRCARTPDAGRCACEDRGAAGAAAGLAGGPHRGTGWDHWLALRDAAEARNRQPEGLAGRSARHRPQLAENFRRPGSHALPLPEKLGPQIRALRPFGVWFGRPPSICPKLLRPEAARC